MANKSGTKMAGSPRLRDFLQSQATTRATRDRAEFLFDRFGISMSRIFDQPDHNTTLPALDGSERQRSVPQLRKGIKLNRKVTDDATSPPKTSVGKHGSTSYKEKTSTQIYFRVGGYIKEKQPIYELLDPVVASQIKKNKEIIDSLILKEKEKTLKTQQSQEFSNMSFLRQQDPAKRVTIFDRSNSPASMQDNATTKKPRLARLLTVINKKPEVSKSSDLLEEANQPANIVEESPMNYNYTSIIDRLASNCHPKSIEEVRLP